MFLEADFILSYFLFEQTEGKVFIPDPSIGLSLKISNAVK